MTTSHTDQPTGSPVEAAFRWGGGAVRLVYPVTDKLEHAIEWGHAEKDRHVVPFGPWSTPDSLSAGPWVWRYGIASAGTGSSYRAVATRVHGDVASREGGPIVVAVLSPWSAAHTFAAEGYLDESYVEEKLARGRHPDDVTALTMLVRMLLGRSS